MFRLLMTALLLFVVIRFRRPCADAVSQFVAGYDEPAAAPAEVPPVQGGLTPGGQGFIEITSNMSEKDIEKAFQELKSRAAARNAQAQGSPATTTMPANP